MSFLKYLNPMHYVQYLIKPGQFNSIARSLLKVAAGALLTLGFSPETADVFVNTNAPILAGLFSLAAGAIASFLAEKDKK